MAVRIRNVSYFDHELIFSKKDGGIGMRKRIFLLIALVLIASRSHAQTQTVVSATVKDSNGIPYAGGSYSIQLIPGGTSPGVNGAPILGAFNGALDATGSFVIALWPNSSIAPGVTQWSFTVCSNPGGIAPPLGTGTQCTPPTAITISGTAQVLSSTLSNVAPKLTNFIGTTTSGVTNGQLLYSNSGVIAGIPHSAANSSIGGFTIGSNDPTAYSFLSNTAVINSFNDTVDPDDVFSLVGSVNEINIGLFMQGLVNRVSVLQTVLQGTNGGIEKIWAKPDGGAIAVVAQAEGNAQDWHIIGTGGLFVDPAADATTYATTVPATVSANQNDVMNLIGSSGAANLNFFERGATNRLIAEQANTQGTNGGAFSIYAKLDGSASISQVVKWAASPAITETVFGAENAVTYQTATNCAGVGTSASPSVASCTAAAAGHFSCATNATGATCQVNTTAVTANSEIFVFESDTAATGTAIGVTCNTSTNVLPASRLLASSVAATSFTINLGTVTTNPACFSYHIIN